MLQEQGLNSSLYWKNTDLRRVISIVPTSAISGEGIPDMLLLLVQMTQKMMSEKLMYLSETQVRPLLPLRSTPFWKRKVYFAGSQYEQTGGFSLELLDNQSQLCHHLLEVSERAFFERLIAQAECLMSDVDVLGSCCVATVRNVDSLFKPRCAREVSSGSSLAILRGFPDHSHRQAKGMRG